jgi:MFS transporter, DHA1 family, tetracycline resistance protein
MRNKQAGIGFIFITLLLDVMGLGIIIPVMPNLIASLTHLSVNEASQKGGYLLFAYAIAQFIFSPLLGAISDKYGRRPVLLISLLGLTIDYLILAWAPNYSWLLIGRIIAGIAGASFTTGAAYIADISTEEDKAKNFGMIGAAFGLGFILGPVIGGLLGKYNSHYPFYAAAIMCFCNLLYGFFVLPESLKPENRRSKIDYWRANPFTTIVKLKAYGKIGWLLVSFFLLAVGSHAVQSNWSYFTNYKFSWKPDVIGYSLGLVGILVGVVQGVLIKKSMQVFGLQKSIYLGFGLHAIGMFLFGMATQSWMMFAFLIPYCLGGISGPALQTLISNQVPANEQGELQGGLTSLQSLSSILGPIMMTSIFAYCTLPNSAIPFAGMPFIVGAILMLTACLITYFVLRTKPNN